MDMNEKITKKGLTLSSRSGNGLCGFSMLVSPAAKIPRYAVNYILINLPNIRQ
jgi:hypothetical protein